MATAEFDICVIGGGAAGLVVAAGGSTLGAKVALVEKHEGGMGGDCLHYGCVPSKTLLRSAKVAHQMRNADRYAFSRAAAPVAGSLRPEPVCPYPAFRRNRLRGSLAPALWS